MMFAYISICAMLSEVNKCTLTAMDMCMFVL